MGRQRGGRVSVTSHDHAGDFLPLSVGDLKAPDECMFNLRHEKWQFLYHLCWLGN